MLCHDCGLIEVHFKLLQTLEAAVSYLTALFRVEHGPFLSVKLLVEIEDKVVMHEIHKRVPDIGHVLVVNGNIEEIVLALVVLVDFLKKQPLVILVRNVFDHHGGPHVIASLDSLDINDKVDMIRTEEGRFGVVVLDTLMRLLQGATSFFDALV